MNWQEFEEALARQAAGHQAPVDTEVLWEKIRRKKRRRILPPSYPGLWTGIVAALLLFSWAHNDAGLGRHQLPASFYASPPPASEQAQPAAPSVTLPLRPRPLSSPQKPPVAVHRKSLTVPAVLATSADEQHLRPDPPHVTAPPAFAISDLKTNADARAIPLNPFLALPLPFPAVTQDGKNKHIQQFYNLKKHKNPQTGKKMLWSYGVESVVAAWNIKRAPLAGDPAYPRTGERPLEAIQTGITIQADWSRGWRLSGGLLYEQCNSLFEWTRIYLETASRPITAYYANGYIDTAAGFAPVTRLTERKVRHYNRVSALVAPFRAGYAFPLKYGRIRPSAGISLRMAQKARGRILGDGRLPDDQALPILYDRPFSMAVSADAAWEIPLSRRFTVFAAPWVNMDLSARTRAGAAEERFYQWGLRAGLIRSFRP